MKSFLGGPGRGISVRPHWQIAFSAFRVGEVDMCGGGKSWE